VIIVTISNLEREFLLTPLVRSTLRLRLRVYAARKCDQYGRNTFSRTLSIDVDVQPSYYYNFFIHIIMFLFI